MQKRFSIISAVYDVESYLPEFIASIEAQDFPLEQVEILMVDDGSTDGSAGILAQWQQRRPGLVTVLTKANGGQGSARNLALEHVTGEWVTMPDPDDTLAPDYLTRVDAFLRKHPDTAMVATNRVLVFDATGERRAHPLKAHFTARDELRDLREQPTFFHGSAPASFFRRDVLERTGLRFDERIRPNFEDGHFCISYLLRVPAPLVGFVTSAVYTYRKRADESSTLNTAGADPRRFTQVPRHGFLDALEQGATQTGGIPVWLQNFVLYELSWYLSLDESSTGTPSALHGPVADVFHETMSEITALLDPAVVGRFTVRRLKPLWRDVLLHAYRPEPWHSGHVLIDKIDLKQQLARVSYRFTHALPDERFLVDGAEVAPVHTKTRAIVTFDRTLVRERIVWLPYGTIAVELGGAAVEVRLDEAGNPWAAEPSRMRAALDPTRVNRQRLAVRALSRSDRLALRIGANRVVRRLLRGSWVLLDRIQDADDSAEHVFRHLRRRHRRVKAWFVIKAGTPDHRRLKRRFPFRVLTHGSLRWRVTMLNCEHLVSTHADVPITAPPAVLRLKAPTWRTTFLQHGVTKDDISGWLNSKDFDLLVVSTPVEYAAMAGDDNSYRYTSREIIETGLPRFDLVRAAGAKFPPRKRDLVLIAPTWRSWLATRPTGRGVETVDWSVDTEAFRASDFGQNWSAVLSAPALRELAERHGARVALLMHPNLNAFADALDGTDGVELHGFDGDVRELFARAKVVVTDYSSMAFNAAYIDRPVVYFQFDKDRMDGGEHIGRRGYFDYEHDGFGPVTFTPDAAVTAIGEALAAGPEPAPVYRNRIEQTFPVRDGGCRERVVRAILASTKRVG